MSALHSVVTSITHNIPSILREPAEALIGKQCYEVLVYDFDVTNTECLKYALSKGLGLGIVLGGGIVKIPQIMKIVSTGSARGLSLSAYILETASYAISLAYASRNKFPFSTYGENFFLTIQNVIITLLIVYFANPGGAHPSGLGSPKHQLSFSQRGNLKGVVSGFAVTVVAAMLLWSDTFCPPSILSLLQFATLPLSITSKAPQIISNYQNQSTGNLSAFAVFNALLGCIARLFTTSQEVNDPLIFWGFAAAGLLNAVLAAQMVMYWQNDLPGRTRRRTTEEGLYGGSSPTKTESEAYGSRRSSMRKLD